MIGIRVAFSPTDMNRITISSGRMADRVLLANTSTSDLTAHLFSILLSFVVNLSSESDMAVTLYYTD